jgi:predicted nuclease with TOPRIM domain
VEEKQKRLNMNKMTDEFSEIKENFIDWAGYADEYFQKKHRLDLDIKQLDEFMEKLRKLESQIDAQAKTMEELRKMYIRIDGLPETEEESRFYNFVRKTYKLGDPVNSMFFLQGYLAAGGVIKE